MKLTLEINGHAYELDAAADRSLAQVLREDLGLTGTKIACNEGHCGACTVQLDGVPTLSCITLVHMVGEREVTTIEGLRERARPGESDPDARRDPARDVWESLPLRHVSENRGGHNGVARLIKTEKEVEGRYEDVWIVVEEDVVEQWPEGPLTVVGRDVPRNDGFDRVRRQIPYTDDLQLPGMLHAAVLRSPHARARVSKLNVEAARQAPGARAVIGPDDLEQLTDEPGYVGHAVAAVAADTFAEAQAALDLFAAEWDVLEPLLDPEEAVRRESYVNDGPDTYERGDL